MALVDTGLVVRYYIDEAASGQVPGAVLDDSVAPDFDLAITYDSTNLNYNEISGNRGLESTSVDGVQRATKLISNGSDKVRDNLESTQKATFEIVARIDNFNSSTGRCFVINEDVTGDIVIGLGGTSGTTAKVYWDTVLMRTFDPGTARAVWHIVYDTTQATANDRVKVYKDGVLQSPTVDANPALNATLTMATDSRMFMFNRGTVSFDSAMDGVIFYGAIYSVAMPQADITTNFDILTADDDTPAAGIVLLDGTAAAVSSLAGALPVDKALGGTVPAVAALSGDLPVSRLMVSTVVAVSSLAGALPVGKGLAATVPATSSLVGALALEWALAGIVPAASTLAGDLTIVGTQLLDGTIVATSTLAGQLPVSKEIGGTVAAISTLDAILGKYRAINGSIDAASTVTGDLQILRALAGAIAGGSTLAGALKLEWALQGVLAGVSALPGSIEVEREIAALVAAFATLSGTLTVSAVGVAWTRERLLTAKDISGPALRAPHRKEIE